MDMDTDEILEEQQALGSDGSDGTDAGGADIDDAVAGVQDAIQEDVTVDDAVEMVRRQGPSLSPLGAAQRRSWLRRSLSQPAPATHASAATLAPRPASCTRLLSRFFPPVFGARIAEPHLSLSPPVSAISLPPFQPRRSRRRWPTTRWPPLRRALRPSR